jgi:hypothetical protein
MTSITALKIVAATLVFVGAIWGFIDINYAPDQILAEGSPERPWWLPTWVGWAMSSTAAILYIVLDYLKSRKNDAALWHAMNAELKFSGGLAESVSPEPVAEVPLYRLPRSAFETCYPRLLADGAMSAAESRALMTFFNEVETLNRGLDLEAHTSDPVVRNQQHGRNYLKAERLAPDGPLYREAAAAIAKHIK